MVLAPNHGGDPLGSILGPMGSHWGKKNGSNLKKLPCPKIRIVDYSAVIDLGKKIELAVMEPNHGGKPLGTILGPMGSHSDQKVGQNRKKLPCPKIRIFDYPAVIDLGKKSNLWLWHQITVGTPYGPSWGQWGPIWDKKRVKKVKMTMPQNSNFWLPRGHRFGQKIEFMVMAPNHGGDPLGSILGPMGSTPRSSNWVKNQIYGFGAKSRWGPPRVHFGANGVPLGPKNGSKP